MKNPLSVALVAFANGGAISSDDYSAALDHSHATNNDRDALRRMMHDNALAGDAQRIIDLANDIELDS